METKKSKDKLVHYYFFYSIFSFVAINILGNIIIASNGKAGVVFFVGLLLMSFAFVVVYNFLLWIFLKKVKKNLYVVFLLFCFVKYLLVSLVPMGGTLTSINILVISVDFIFLILTSLIYLANIFFFKKE